MFGSVVVDMHNKYHMHVSSAISLLECAISDLPLRGPSDLTNQGLNVFINSFDYRNGKLSIIHISRAWAADKIA